MVSSSSSPGCERYHRARSQTERDESQTLPSRRARLNDSHVNNVNARSTEGKSVDPALVVTPVVKQSLQDGGTRYRADSPACTHRNDRLIDAIPSVRQVSAAAGRSEEHT